MGGRRKRVYQDPKHGIPGLIGERANVRGAIGPVGRGVSLRASITLELRLRGATGSYEPSGRRFASIHVRKPAYAQT